MPEELCLDEICFCDIETTGLSEEHEPFEVALIVGGKEHLFWLDVDLTKASPDALELNRFYERRKEGYARWHVSKQEAAEKITLLTSRKYLAGSGPKFDAAKLDAFLRRHQMPPAWKYKVIDVPLWAAGVLGMPPPISVRKVNEALGIVRKEEDLHTAMGDARWVRDMLARAMAIRNARQEKLGLVLRELLKGAPPADDAGMSAWTTALAAAAGCGPDVQQAKAAG